MLTRMREERRVQKPRCGEQTKGAKHEYCTYSLHDFTSATRHITAEKCSVSNDPRARQRKLRGSTNTSTDAPKIETQQDNRQERGAADPRQGRREHAQRISRWHAPDIVEPVSEHDETHRADGHGSEERYAHDDTQPFVGVLDLHPRVRPTSKSTGASASATAQRAPDSVRVQRQYQAAICGLLGKRARWLTSGLCRKLWSQAATAPTDVGGSRRWNTWAPESWGRRMRPLRARRRQLLLLRCGTRWCHTPGRNET